MTKMLQIRCKHCGKVLRAQCTDVSRTGICPNCNTKLTIPKLSDIEARRNERAVIEENSLTTQLPDALVNPKEAPVCRVMYTEAPPFQVALKRKNHAPVLDLSQGGLRFLMRSKEAEGVTTGKTVLIEIDFPILIQPIYAYVDVCWMNATEDHELVQVGVEFHDPDKDLQRIVSNLAKYVLSRPEAQDQATDDA